jgi:hypothetical protein
LCTGQPAECDCSLCGPYDHLVWEVEGATMDRYIKYIVFKEMFIEYVVHKEMFIEYVVFQGDVHRVRYVYKEMFTDYTE